MIGIFNLKLIKYASNNHLSYHNQNSIFIGKNQINKFPLPAGGEGWGEGD